MAADRSTEKPVSRRNGKEERKLKRKLKRKQAEKDDVSQPDERMEVLHERKSKKKKDEMVDEPESKSKDVSSSHEVKELEEKAEEEKADEEKAEEEKADEEKAEEEKADEEKAEEEKAEKEKDEMVVLPSSSTSNSLKGLISEDVSNKQSVKKQAAVKGPQLFKKLFSYDDEEEILQVLIREGEDRGSKGFWKRHMNSMPLSITVNELQLYEKGRRLQESYFRRLKKTHAFRNVQQRKLFELGAKLWGNEEKKKKKRISHVKVKAKGKGKGKGKKASEMTMDNQYQNDYDKFAIEFVSRDVDLFPFDDAMKVVPFSMRSNFENKWEELYKEKVLLVGDIIKAIKARRLSSSS